MQVLYTTKRPGRDFSLVAILVRDEAEAKITASE